MASARPTSGRPVKAPIKIIERRLLALLVIFSIVALVIGTRITWLQAVESDKLKKIALDQRLRKIALPAARGRILDRNGEELAASRPVMAVFATPYHVKERKLAARVLAKRLHLETKDVEEKLSRNSGFVYIARQVPVEIADAIQQEGLAGIGLLDESKRVYPGGRLAAQTLGFTDIDGKGLAGLEAYYGKTLGGRPGELIAEKDPRGRSIPGGIHIRRPPIAGKDVQLTIDRDIQYQTEKAIYRAYKLRKATSVTAIVMEVKTGELLAVASVPSFDPGKPKTRKPELIRNRALADVYEPGSTFKTTVIAGALEDRVIKPTDSFYLGSSIRVGNHNVKESHGRAGRVFTVSDIIAESSNVGAVTIGLKMGKLRLYDWVQKWGFTTSSGVDFPGAGIGFLPAPKDWSGTTIGNVPIGQGVAITPLALLRAVAAMGNDGIMVSPHLTRSIAGKIDKVSPPKRVISSRTASEIMPMLEKVVEEGTGTEAAIDGYRVAGKTGTAQRARTDGRGYAPGSYVGSFVGLMPVSDPEIAIIVLLDQPKAGYYGGVVAAPVFGEIGEFALRKLRIVPDGLKEAGKKSEGTQ